MSDLSWGTGSAMRTYFGNYPNDPSLLERFERNVATPRGMSELVRRNCLIDVRSELGHRFCHENLLRQLPQRPVVVGAVRTQRGHSAWHVRTGTAELSDRCPI